MKSFQANIQLTQNSKLDYLLHVPKQAASDPDNLWPAILFLHGYGESGADLSAVLDVGLPPYIAGKPDFPFIVIAPQCPWFAWWPELASSLDQLLEQCIETLPIDPQRLYLTGLSMGGFGCWYLGSAWPRKFAAIAPICGGGYWFHGFPERVTEMNATPVWTFHGAKDDVVPLASTEELVTALRDSGGDVKFTVYPEADHDSWTETYNNPQLYEWFLQHMKEQ
jgi:predicted peptidase